MTNAQPYAVHDCNVNLNHVQSTSLESYNKVSVGLDDVPATRRSPPPANPKI